VCSSDLWRFQHPEKLKVIAAELSNIMSRTVRVYGDKETLITDIATATGSGGGRIPEALFAKADLLISGEFRYHDALAAVESGLTLIELGHDISEQPLVAMIAEAIHARSSIPDDRILIDEARSLWQPLGSGFPLIS
jgi:putative NIF3 family GTP cyclohydrolase 1 type 2